MSTFVTDPPVQRPTPDFLNGPAKQLLIGGQWRPASTGETLDSIDPTTAEVHATVAAASANDVDLAVTAARRAFEDPSWANITPYQRSRVLLQIADVIESHRDELTLLETLDNGCPLMLNAMLVDSSVESFRYYAGWPTKLYGETAPSTSSEFNYTLRQPVGVCAAIIPWNSPLWMAAWKLAPALAFGNTSVLKPAEQTPLTAIRLGELLQETDLPPGVVNILTGYGETTGEALISHPGVNKVAFTGSGAVGKHIVATSARDLKRVTLELGGKSPNIVFDDADLSAAAVQAAAAFCLNSGQICVAGTRIYVQEAVREEFSQLLYEELGKYSVGDPVLPTSMMGPLVSREQFDRVAGYLDEAREHGATIRPGNSPASGPGYFMAPALVEGVSATSRIVREEVFGPVATIMPFHDVDDVVRQANDTEYGLAAAIWTKDISRAHRVAAAIDAGMVWVNRWGHLDLSLPFGGFKQSGLGREHGTAAQGMYTETKSVMVAL